MRTISACLLVVLAVCSALAQPPSSEPDKKPRKVTSERTNVIKDWIENEGSVLVTDAEARVFKNLKSDEERENFIEIIWRRRDPDPDTEENEFREEFYERIAYANANFTSGKPGWKTDRGRIYIRWGKPDSVESRPSGGSYDRPSYHGGGSTTTYPFEIWFYRHLDTVGDGIEVEFVDPTGTGEYRIARSPDEKDALAMVPGASRRDPNDPNRDRYLREPDTPFRRLEIITAMDRNAPVKNGGILDGPGVVGSPVIDNNPLFFDVRVDLFRQSEDRVIAVFTTQANNRQFTFTDVGGLQTAKLNIVGRVTSVAGKRAGTFEDVVSTSATTPELVAVRDRDAVYQKAMSLAPGHYRLDMGLRDVVTGNKGVNTIAFEVPRYDSAKLSTSTLILASKLRPTDPNDIGGLFVINSVKVIPNVTGKFKQGQDVGIYLQAYNSGIDQTTLRPAVNVRYVLMKDGKEVYSQPEDWSGLSDSGQRLTLARLLPTDRLPLGDYEVRVVMVDKVSGQTIENKSKFSLEK
ncbi:MAG: GWxTD domain-containing protein [Pyrinomonadaceae bacterium]